MNCYCGDLSLIDVPIAQNSDVSAVLRAMIVFRSFIFDAWHAESGRWRGTHQLVLKRATLNSAPQTYWAGSPNWHNPALP